MTTLCFKHRFIAISILVLAVIWVANAGTIRSATTGSSTLSNERKLKPLFAYEYTATVNKTEYVFGENIGLTQVSNTGIFGKIYFWNFMILPEKDLHLVENPTKFALTSFSNHIIAYNGTIVKHDFFGFEYTNDYYPLLANGLNYNTKEARASTNVTIPNQTVLDTKLVFVTTEDVLATNGSAAFRKVVSVSNTFKFKLNFINITLNKKTYKPGETLKLDFTKQSFANRFAPQIGSSDEFMKIFKVQSSYTNTPLKFNNATVAKYQYWTNTAAGASFDRQLITWTEPGKYQAVLFDARGQIILGTSTVFEVRKPNTIKNVSVVMDKTTYLPFQNLSFTIKADRQLKGRQVTFSIAHANATEKDFSDSTKIIHATTETWKVAKKEVTFSYINTIVQPGSYKVGVTISIGPGDDYALFITKPFTVSQLPISVVSDPPRKTFPQGEVVRLNILNPNNFQFFEQSDYTMGYGIAVVNAGFPNNGPIVGPLFLDIYSTYIDFAMYIPSGQYQFALFSLGSSHVDFENDFVYALPNSDFTVTQNNATVTTDQRQYKKNTPIYITLSTQLNVTLGASPSPLHQVKLKHSISPNVTEDFSDKYGFDTRIDGNLIGRRYVINTTGIFSIVVYYGIGPGQNSVWAESKLFSVTNF